MRMLSCLWIALPPWESFHTLGMLSHFRKAFPQCTWSPILGILPSWECCHAYEMPLKFLHQECSPVLWMFWWLGNSSLWESSPIWECSPILVMLYCLGNVLPPMEFSPALGIVLPSWVFSHLGKALLPCATWKKIKIWRSGSFRIVSICPSMIHAFLQFWCPSVLPSTSQLHVWKKTWIVVCVYPSQMLADPLSSSST